MEKIKKILIIDDDIELAELIKARLELTGYSSKIAGDAYEGNKEIINNNYDLIILDLGLPVGEGFELLKRIKNIPKKSNIPVIILTAKTIDMHIIEKANKYHIAAIFHSL